MFSFSSISGYLFISTLISLLTHFLFSTMLFSLHVSVAEDDSTGMTAFGFVSGGCRGVCAASTGRRPGAGSGFFVVVVRIFFASF